MVDIRRVCKRRRYFGRTKKKKIITKFWSICHIWVLTF